MKITEQWQRKRRKEGVKAQKQGIVLKASLQVTIKTNRTQGVGCNQSPRFCYRAEPGSLSHDLPSSSYYQLTAVSRASIAAVEPLLREIFNENQRKTTRIRRLYQLKFHLLVAPVPGDKLNRMIRTKNDTRNCQICDTKSTTWCYWRGSRTPESEKSRRRYISWMKVVGMIDYVWYALKMICLLYTSPSPRD